MGFYELLCEHYDDIFPATREGMRFANSLLGDKASVLDLGCGTGNKTVFLAEGRREVLGIDADPAMIAFANARHAADNVAYRVMDINDIGNSLVPVGFDAAICLGNTIPHITGDGALLRVFGHITAILRPDGCFVGQLLNYRRIADRNITELPVVETGRVVFRRTYEWREGVMYFREEIRDKRGGEITTDSIPMRPIFKEEVEDTLRRAGFAAIEFWGGLDGKAFAPDSYHVVFRAAVNSR